MTSFTDGRSLCLLLRSIAACFLLSSVVNAEAIIESPREIPVVGDVDVAVVGGSSGAVRAACEATRAGASVFLIAPRPYLGDDLCATLRLWLEDGREPTSDLAKACFADGRVAIPSKVKAEMDRALLRAGVTYLTGCYATDVLLDRNGGIAGIVMANRSGRQAIRTKVVVDATDYAIVARLAGAKFRPDMPGRRTFSRIVAGGKMQSGDGVTARQMEFTYDSVAKKKNLRLPVYLYELEIDRQDNSLQSFFNAEHRARDLTYHVGSETASEVLFCAPSDTIVGETHLDAWNDESAADLGVFRPKGLTRLYVLSAYADLAGDASKRMRQPLTHMEVGARIGHAAAMEAAKLPVSASASLPAADTASGMILDVREQLDGIRSMNHGTIDAEQRTLPILGRYDVVVVGGGTSGAPAGIGAAKSGAKTLVVESLYELGGVGTVGLIAKYWYGLRRGYTQYVDNAVNDGKTSWNAVEKAEWLRRELLNCGADVWFGTLGCGALVDGGKVRGIVVATPWGRGAVLASTVVDATGNADIAACAGTPTQFGISDLDSLNVQIAGFPERPVANSYVNTCYTMVDDTDVLDVWHLMAWKRTRTAKPSAFDVGQLIDSRERRRIVGDFVLTVPDILNHRTFPDTISQHYSNFDAAAFPDSPLLLADDAKGPSFHTDLSYRCLLPQGLDGLLVVGLGASAERDAMTLIRMQADLQNQGYAAGMAAASAARLDGRTRSIDIKSLQRELVQQQVLDERVLTDEDSYPLSDEAIEQAVQAVDRDNQEQTLKAVAIIMAHPARAIPQLKTHYRNSNSRKERLAIAKILGILGDPTGAPDLIAAVDSYEAWDQGKAWTSQRDTGNTFSDLDRLVIALGKSGDRAALPALQRKLQQLTPSSEISHYKAISLALRNHRTPDVVQPLARLLSQSGFTGHATVAPVVTVLDNQGKERFTIADRYVTTANDSQANNTNLNRAFKELIIAAMLYRHGDQNGQGQAILDQYARDIHGHFAARARRALRK